MPSQVAPTKRVSKISLYGLVIGMLLVIVLIVMLVRQRNSIEEVRQANEQARIAAEEVLQRRQVKRLELRRINEDGEEEILEVLLTGHVNIYDADGNLKKEGIQGFYKVGVLLNKVDRLLKNSTYSTVKPEGCSIEVETNSGIVYIPCDDGTGLVDEIEGIVDETLNPTPTPTFVPTPTYSGLTPTAGPSPTFGPSPTPLPSAPGPTLTPTPLPDYMTAPPFSCETYESLGRPVVISGVICGAD